jgi:hypothetical protein
MGNDKENMFLVYVQLMKALSRRGSSSIVYWLSTTPSRTKRGR